MTEKEFYLKFGLKKFNGNDFKVCKMRVRIALEAGGCETAIANTFSI